MKTVTYLTIVFCLIGNLSIAQQGLKYCNYIGPAKKQIDFDNNTVNDGNIQEVKKIIREIVNLSGNVSTWDLRANHEVPNATALRRNGRQEIHYNPKWVKDAKAKGDKWILYSVFAHEVAHHQNFHLLKDENRKDEEIQADETSGFILFKLGATLAEAQKSIRFFGNQNRSEHHPPVTDRLAAIERGYKKASSAEPVGYRELVQKADNSFDNGEYDKAFRQYQRASSKKPDDDYVKRQLAIVKEYVKDVKKNNEDPALNQRNSTITKSDDQYYSLIKLGDDAFEREEYQDAVYYYNKALEEKPDDQYAADQGALSLIGMGYVSDLVEESNNNSKLSSSSNTTSANTTTVHFNYRGDYQGCSVGISIQVGDLVWTPTANSFYLYGVPTGNVTYRIFGTVSCPTGVCQIDVTRNGYVSPNAVLYFYWENTAWGVCDAWLDYQ